MWQRQHEAMRPATRWREPGRRRIHDRLPLIPRGSEQGPAPPPRHGAGAGGACITLQYVSNVIIHNIHVHDCVPAGNANVRASPTHYGWHTRFDGDGISLYSARDVWVDHCALSRCADGLIDAIMGSTAITVSNSYFSHHNEVMLLGHGDEYLLDSAMQVTIAFNHFGIQLVQRMPLFPVFLACFACEL
ncbi:probable pectate lyase 12 [Oryza glaberrima]|uniref:probable pectate lyase 12 n=1 Tax=Oryza glaberrima TaxID=4538 RepID=UPI00224C1925|nr:probable pectate lyase 12 [Oryza glaberrima]